MKQIPFTLEAFTPDGMLKDGYEVRYKGCKVNFVKYYKQQDIISGVDETGDVFSTHDVFSTYSLVVNGGPYQMYRRTRTAEEVAKETSVKIKESPEWDRMGDAQQILRRLYVQAGMDEMKND